MPAISCISNCACQHKLSVWQQNKVCDSAPGSAERCSAVSDTSCFVCCVQCAEAEKKTAGGVLLASESADRPNFGTVVAVGEGKKTEEGEQVKPNVTVGATVMYQKYSGTEFEVSWVVTVQYVCHNQSSA